MHTPATAPKAAAAPVATGAAETTKGTLVKPKATPAADNPVGAATLATTPIVAEHAPASPAMAVVDFSNFLCVFSSMNTPPNVVIFKKPFYVWPICFGKNSKKIACALEKIPIKVKEEYRRCRGPYCLLSECHTRPRPGPKLTLNPNSELPGITASGFIVISKEKELKMVGLCSWDSVVCFKDRGK